MIGNFVSRRDLIRVFSCLGVSATLFPSVAGIAPATLDSARKTTRDTAGNVVGDLTDLISNKTSAAEIGNVYLSQYGPVKDPESIASSIIAAVGRPRATPGEIRAALYAQIRDDFTHGRTVLVGGWVLSQTEASVCALVAATAVS